MALEPREDSYSRVQGTLKMSRDSVIMEMLVQLLYCTKLLAKVENKKYKGAMSIPFFKLTHC